MNHTHPAGTPAPEVDVAVVGAGVIGLATAWTLRREGLRVAVIDPAPGSGASRAAAGMIAPASEVQYQHEELRQLMGAAAAEYPDFVAGLEAATGAGVGLRTAETLVCAAHPGDREALADLQHYQARREVPVEQVTTRRARALEPALSPRLAGAFFAPGDHQVDPRRLVAALLSALTGGDHPGPAEMVADDAVEIIASPAGVSGVRLAGGGRVTAAETVLAPGLGLSRIRGLPGPLRPPLRAVHGDIVRAGPPEGQPRHPPLLQRTVRGLVGGLPVYLVPREDGEIVIGATAREDGLERPTVGGVFHVLRDARTLVPGVVDLELREVMTRARPGTPDDLPVLGRVRDPDGAPVPGLVLSTGYFRHGVMLAPWAARLTARLVAGDPAPEDAHRLRVVAPHRFSRPGPGETEQKPVPIDSEVRR